MYSRTKEKGGRTGREEDMLELKDGLGMKSDSFPRVSPTGRKALWMDKDE